MEEQSASLRYLWSEPFLFVIAGTRIGQASECFVYWKDTVTNDTWGLNFTSPIDAKQFRECCVSFFFLITRLCFVSFSFPQIGVVVLLLQCRQPSDKP